MPLRQAFINSPGLRPFKFGWKGMGFVCRVGVGGGPTAQQQEQCLCDVLSSAQAGSGSHRFIASKREGPVRKNNYCGSDASRSRACPSASLEMVSGILHAPDATNWQLLKTEGTLHSASGTAQMKRIKES